VGRFGRIGSRSAFPRGFPRRMLLLFYFNPEGTRAWWQAHSRPVSPEILVSIKFRRRFLETRRNRAGRQKLNFESGASASSATPARLMVSHEWSKGGLQTDDVLLRVPLRRQANEQTASGKLTIPFPAKTEPKVQQRYRSNSVKDSRNRKVRDGSTRGGKFGLVSVRRAILTHGFGIREPELLRAGSRDWIRR
jgi:hypothetical protein